MMDLFKTSYKAHQDYVTSHIENVNNNKYYLVISNQILELNFKELDSMNEYLKAQYRAFSKRNDNWLRWDSSPNKYKLLAIGHAIELAENLDMRFNKGWSKAYLLPGNIK